MFCYLSSNAQDCYLTDSNGSIVKKCSEIIKANESKKFEQGTYLIQLKTLKEHYSKQVAMVQMQDAPVLKVKSNCLYLTNDTIEGEEILFGSEKWKQYNRQILQIKANVDIEIKYLKKE